MIILTVSFNYLKRTRTIFKYRALTWVLLGQVLAITANPATAAELKVMSYNIRWGGVSEQHTLEQTMAVIKTAGADIVGIQERQVYDDGWRNGVGEDNVIKLADMLGWHRIEQNVHPDLQGSSHNDVAIISRYPAKKELPWGLGAVIDVNGEDIVIVNLHLYAAPYQPFQLMNIDYAGFPFIKTESEAIRWANHTRGKTLDILESELSQLGEVPVVITGDFNEPSHLDWTAAAAAAGLHPIKVEWPSTRRLTDIGFVDTYRQFYPDEVARPGATWTPTTSPDDPKDHHDRIDFVLVRGENVKIMDAAIVGECKRYADVVVAPYPSDHRATMATLKVN